MYSGLVSLFSKARGRPKLENPKPDELESSKILIRCQLHLKMLRTILTSENSSTEWVKNFLAWKSLQRLKVHKHSILFSYAGYFFAPPSFFFLF